MQQGARLVFGAQAALFLDHFQLFFELTVRPLVMGKAVGLQLHHFFQPRGGNLLVKAGVILAGKGILAPAQGRDPARERTGRHGRCTFEHHVLQHMRHTGGAVHLVHGTHPHPQHVDGSGRASIGFDDDGQAIGQGKLFHRARGLRVSRQATQKQQAVPGQALPHSTRTGTGGALQAWSN